MKHSKKNINLLFVLLAIILCACSNVGAEDNTDTVEDQNIQAEKALVDVIKIERKDFFRQIICNGTLLARQKAALQFRTNGIIDKILIKNGDKVSKGQIIAQLERFTLQNELERNKAQLKDAELTMKDILIGQGHTQVDTSQIPHEIISAAKTKSGYMLAMSNFKLAQYNFDASILNAPFSGIITGLNKKPFNSIKQNEVFCTLIDDAVFEATFSILENELQDVKNGLKVTIVPFAYDTLSFQGIISEIDPMIDENGQLQVKARVNNKNNKLYEGMNVKIIIKIPVHDQLMVPKEAIVVRSGKEVVFTYSKGYAKWNYVKTGFENSTSYMITTGLHDGDSVIINGNLNLGHDSEVKLSN